MVKKRVDTAAGGFEKESTTENDWPFPKNSADTLTLGVHKMGVKPLGSCPFCKENVAPTIVEKNTFRRDKCICPLCKATLYVCRTPGCHDYAKGGDSYDDELCPECTGNTVTGVGALAVLVVTAVVNDKIDKVLNPGKD